MAPRGRGHRAHGTLKDPAARARAPRDGAGHVTAIVEAKDAGPQERAVCEINAGIYAFTVPRLLEVLSALRPQNAQGEYYLTDVIGLLRKQGHTVAAVCAQDASEAQGVNTLVELAEVTAVLRQRRLLALMLAGATIEDPDSTFVA